jgi:hypothetical protein
MNKSDAQRREAWINRSLMVLFISIFLFMLVILYGIIGIPIAVFVFGVEFIIAATPFPLGLAGVVMFMFGGLGIVFLWD